MLGRVGLLWAVWRGQLGPWQGVHLQIRTPFKALVILGVMALVQRDLPFAICCPACSPSQARHQEGYMGGPSQLGQAWALGGTAGQGSHLPSFHLCQGSGAQGLACFAGCWDPALSHGEVCSGFRGRRRPGGGCGAAAHLPSSQATLERRDFPAALEVACMPLRDPHQVGGSPPLHLRPR